MSQPDEAPAPARPDRRTLERWVGAVGHDLAVPPAAVDIDRLLDLARDAAHGVARPAAPLTTYLAGYAVAATGGDEAALDRVLARLVELTEQWPADDAGARTRP